MSASLAALLDRRNVLTRSDAQRGGGGRGGSEEEEEREGAPKRRKAIAAARALIVLHFLVGVHHPASLISAILLGLFGDMSVKLLVHPGHLELEQLDLALLS